MNRAKIKYFEITPYNIEEMNILILFGSFGLDLHPNPDPKLVAIRFSNTGLIFLDSTGLRFGRDKKGLPASQPVLTGN